MNVTSEAPGNDFCKGWAATEGMKGAGTTRSMSHQPERIIRNPTQNFTEPRSLEIVKVEVF